jgi:uncharacterized protein (DUF608 family)
MLKNKYSYEELFASGPQKIYKDEFLNEISFPIGGIGTGSIGLSGKGSLINFEIFNRPNIGSWFPKTFPVIRVKEQEKDPICRILEGPIQRPYTPRDGGAIHFNGEGFPHMDCCEFRGEYPFAWIDFYCDKMPIKVQLEAYNPFIPSDPDASSYPAVILRYYITNTSKKQVEVSILWSLLNLVGFNGDEGLTLLADKPFEPKGKFFNEFMENENIHGIFYGNREYTSDHPKYGSMALTSPAKDITYTNYWSQDIWFTPHYQIWNSFKETGKAVETKKKPLNKAEAGAIASSKVVNPGETKSFTFYITWYFPNFVKYWPQSYHGVSLEVKPTWKNYYATLFKDAFDVADKLNQREAKLYKETKLFHDALFSSTLPPFVIDAVASNISILKTTTCLRLQDGTFYGWEGCSSTRGSCEGTCAHVWGYQQALPFLFPSLERSIHDVNYKYNFFKENSGALKFRLQLPLGYKGGWVHPCADGQFGGVIHVYREWKLSGDDEWLKNIWSKVKRALEYAWENWDPNKMGFLDKWQHNTYDIDFYGPNPMLSCYYLGALRAGAEMANYLGQNNIAKEYLKVFENGRKWIDDNLFNGEYYIQKYDSTIAKANQFGQGCLIDQLIGQQLTRIAGLGNFLKTENINTTLKSIFKYNWKPNMQEHENGARLYAVNDEAATIICTWPKGDRPEIPFPYADEVMNGFEYQFAVHCILEGLLEEGLTVIKSIRDRYDGYGRNPWDEFECGHYYARSMASYGALIALTGFEFDKGKGYLGFNPAINQKNFKTFWSLDGVWGTYLQTHNIACIEVLYGNVSLERLKLPYFSNAQKVNLLTPDKQYSVNFDKNGLIILPEKIKLEKSQSLILKT